MANPVGATPKIGYRETLPPPKPGEPSKITEAIRPVIEQLADEQTALIAENSFLKTQIIQKDSKILALQKTVDRLTNEVAEKTFQLQIKDEALKGDDNAMRAVLTTRIESLETDLKQRKEHRSKTNRSSRSTKELERAQTTPIKTESAKELEPTQNNTKIDAQPDDVHKPTTAEMKNKLKELIPFSQESAQLRKDVDGLRSELQHLCKVQIITADNLDAKIKTHVVTFHHLSSIYLKLNPRLKDETEKLDQMIKKATHNPILDEALNAMSAYNNLSLKFMDDNKKNFEIELQEVIEQNASFQADINHLFIRFGDIIGHLNNLDYKLGNFKNTNSLMSHLPVVGGSSKYISPTNSSYTGTEGTEQKPAADTNVEVKIEETKNS